MKYYWTIFVCVILMNSHCLVFASEIKHEAEALALSNKSITEITPGKVMAKRQKEELTRERFVDVFGETIINQWGIDWDILSDDSRAFDDATKRLNLNRILSKMDKIKSHVNPDFYRLYGESSMIKREMDTVHSDRLDNVTIKYFTSYFPCARVECDVKSIGVQLGAKANVFLITGETKKYHVKTHSAGRLSSRSTNAKVVDPKELLVYKVLEYAGFGCETHFLQRSIEDVYIATLDAGYNGSFNVFSRATGGQYQRGDEILGRTLWSMLDSVDEDPKKNDCIAIETSAQSNTLTQNFMLQISALDLLSRILRLHDLLNNPDNFGFSMQPDHLPSLKVIDFRVSDELVFKVNEDHFGGFLIGNGIYNYVGSHRTMRYCLHDRPVESRVNTALYTLRDGALAQAHACVERAYEEVMRYITTADVFTTSTPKMIEQLNIFNEAIHHNISFFHERLSLWTPEKER